MFDQTDRLLTYGKGGFKNIFLEYYQPLCHLSYHYLEDEDEAKEVVQEAFVKLWEMRENLDKDSNIQNFLFTLVKNNCLNILKRKQMLAQLRRRAGNEHRLYQACSSLTGKRFSLTALTKASMAPSTVPVSAMKLCANFGTLPCVMPSMSCSTSI